MYVCYAETGPTVLYNDTGVVFSEEKLKAFMTESDSKISSIRQYSDHRTKSRRR